MRVIDEKGKIFGKINVIDFLVILFLLCLLPGFYFGYKILIKKSAAVIVSSEKKFITMEINCRFIKLKPKVARAISIDDRELDENGQIIGEVVHLGEITPYIYEFNVGGGKKLIKEDPILKQISATLRIRAKLKGDNLYYKDRQILDNSIVNFITDKYCVEAVVLLSSTATSDNAESSLIKEIRDELFILRQKITDIEKRMDDLENG
jgi:hypothetical protein